MENEKLLSFEKAQRLHFILFLLGVTTALISFRETFVSMFNIWYTSEDFQHGLLIIPISLFLAWKKRDEVKSVEFNINYIGLLFVIGLSVLWLLGDVGGVQVIKHFVAMSLLSAIVLTSLGFGVFKILIFPLGYLLLAVPTHGPFVYPLQQITADIVYLGLQLTGIPVFREGQLVYIPAGTFEVAEACSGIRFLTATVTLSILFTYISYRTYKKRIIFLLLAIIIPIVANGLRAFFIVLAGHFISMEFAGGADHIIFGWQFFGVIMFLMFWIGSKWSDTHEDDIKNEGK